MLARHINKSVRAREAYRGRRLKRSKQVLPVIDIDVDPSELIPIAPFLVDDTLVSKRSRVVRHHPKNVKVQLQVLGRRK
uniref:30S ribosomal protein S17 n=1 Tax=Steinernema glaseri TaxID=37863 RepID=A0A1I7Y990_9BILA